MREVKNTDFEGERSLFQIKNTNIDNCTFHDGESPLKETQNIKITNSTFQWKYPLWYGKNIIMSNSKFESTARAGVWYTKNIIFEDSIIEAPKTFRRCKNILLKNIEIPNALETLWHCNDIELLNVKASGPYFALNSSNIKITNFELHGDYCFDGGKNIEVHNAKLLSKDAFWNCKNVVVYDSYISGEYLAWNSKNITFINCTIESLQGMCYVENLVMRNCKLINTTLAFEYSTVDAQISSGIDSVINPSSGKITADFIKELIIEKDKVDPSKTIIICHLPSKE